MNRRALAIAIVLAFLGFASAVARPADDLATGLHYKLVSRELVESRLKRYAGNDREREQTLKQIFAEAGCTNDRLSEQTVPGTRQPNIVCVLPGSSDRVLIIGAHFDHVDAGDGVVDNWSGASLLPSLYQAASGDPRNHTLIFVAFTDEEKGEIGSHFYAQHMTKDQIAVTDAMVNMDTLGLAPTEIWLSHSDKTLSGALVYVSKQLQLPVTGVDVDQIGSTDSVQFSARRIPAITIHSLTQEAWNARILHTAKDKFSAMNLDDYYQTYSLLAPYIVFLDKILPVTPGSKAR